jgi:7,8-dihydropterin-6-yl-methyl-4-(beta-D-ribofuranosyl)aminobenzene 5'-phosphate synthase
LVKVTIIYDNTACEKTLEADWGFAALIEAYGRILLFDTGANGEILLRNMQVLKIDPLSISDLFISHGHFDHIGGLSHFLNENRNIVLHAPVSLRGVRQAKEVRYYDKPQKIHDHFITTGELEQIEQSLAVETEKGLLVIAGCSHPAMENILGAFSSFGTVYGIVGGLHGFDQFHLFAKMGLICPTHCTQHAADLEKHFPWTYTKGGAGRILEI